LKEFIGVPHNINQPIMGIITTKLNNWFVKNSSIFVVKDQNQLSKKFSLGLNRRHLMASVVSDHVQFSPLGGIPCLSDVNGEVCEALNAGDVVLIEPSGNATILYLKNSPHNSLFLTNRCNCLCIMCPQPPTADPENLLGMNLKLISLLGKVKPPHLGITGGEPTLLGDDLIKIIAECGEKIPNTSLTLLTNARKLQNIEFAKALVQAGRCKLVIEVPLFSDNDTEHDSITGAKGSFYETLRGLYSLALLEQPVGLRMVLHALTIERLPQYTEFIYRNLPFVINVAFMGMETTGLAEKNLDLLWADPYEYWHKLNDAVKFLVRRNVPVSIYNHQLCTLPRDLWPFAKRSISTWKETYLPLCSECNEKNNCCGIFVTGVKHSDFLNAL